MKHSIYADNYLNKVSKSEARSFLYLKEKKCFLMLAI